MKVYVISYILIEKGVIVEAVCANKSAVNAWLKQRADTDILFREFNYEVKEMDLLEE